MNSNVLCMLNIFLESTRSPSIFSSSVTFQQKCTASLLITNSSFLLARFIEVPCSDKLAFYMQFHTSQFSPSLLFRMFMHEAHVAKDAIYGNQWEKPCPPFDIECVLYVLNQLMKE